MPHADFIKAILNEPDETIAMTKLAEEHLRLERREFIKQASIVAMGALMKAGEFDGKVYIAEQAVQFAEALASEVLK